MKNFIEVTSINGQQVLINVRNISLVIPTTGSNEPEFSNISTDSEYRYTFIELVGCSYRIASYDDYSTIIKRINDSTVMD